MDYGIIALILNFRRHKGKIETLSRFFALGVAARILSLPTIKMNYFLFPSTQPASGKVGAAGTGGTAGTIALFDVDGTLVTSKSGRRWAADDKDWIFLGDVPAVFRDYHEKGYIIALVSNQSEWKLSDTPRAKFQSILDALTAANGWAPWCLIATAKIKERDILYRKPGRGLYDLLLAQLGLSVAVGDLIMCGDASGSSDPFPPYRWSDSDRAFATAIGAKFLRPCDVFGTAAAAAAPAPPTQEIILLVGNPGSGKSTTARRFAAAGYVHLEQDVIGTKAAVLKAARSAVAAKSSVVIDATHGSQVNRDPYIDLAKKHNIPCRILWHIRDGRSFNQLREHPVPEVAYAVYSKHFVEPIGTPIY
jgi:bifunctional polynucleotide phosphatase/kinase